MKVGSGLLLKKIFGLLSNLLFIKSYIILSNEEVNKSMVYFSGKINIRWSKITVGCSNFSGLYLILGILNFNPSTPINS